MGENVEQDDELRRKAFALDLHNSSSNIRDIYSRLATKRQLELVRENKNRPVQLTVDQKEKLLREARVRAQFPNVDPDKMRGDWEAAISKKGRPPIGGAQE